MSSLIKSIPCMKNSFSSMLIFDHLDHWSIASPKSKYKSRAETELTDSPPMVRVLISMKSFTPLSTGDSATIQQLALESNHCGKSAVIRSSIAFFSIRFKTLSSIICGKPPRLHTYLIYCGNSPSISHETTINATI